MAFLKKAFAGVTHPNWGTANWQRFVDEHRAQMAGTGYRGLARVASGTPNLIAQASEILQDEFSPEKYLLTHATIVASVDTDEVAGQRLGAFNEMGRNINRKWANYRVKPSCDIYINNNHDCWDRPVLLKSYRTFVGAHNFVEHVQIEQQSKGRIIDAAARDIGDSIYTDILIATDRRHTSLIRDIEAGRMGTMSMGCSVTETQCTKCGNVAADETEMCFPPGTRVLLGDGRYVPIEEIVEGDLVITHTGETHTVTETMRRQYDGELVSLNVDGVPAALRSTPNHPYWVLRPAQICACGCEQPLRRTVEHERGSVKAFQRRFLPGHNTRLQNPNPDASNVVEMAEFNRLFEIDLEFAEARDLNKGDYLAFPIPQGSENTGDATTNRARLIGYFLAEGSFVKREGKKVGVDFTFGHHEYDSLAAEVVELLDAEFGREERRVASADWQTLVAENPVSPVQRRSTSRPVPSDVSCPACSAPSDYALNVRFKKGADDCYKCKVCDRHWVDSADRSVQARRYRKPLETENSGTTVVRLMDDKAAEFFFKYCGEYSNEKCLDPSVLRWEPAIQKHVLFGWLGGDATQCEMGIVGTTTSFQLLSQMHILAARSNLYAYKKATFAGKTTTFNQVVNGNGSVTVRDHRGWLPSFGLVISDPQGFSDEVRFSDRETARVSMSGLTDGFKRVGNWLIYRIREVSRELYSGIVHNFEVEKDHSYVVEGLAVHNCEHIKYAKGNYEFDARGNKYRIAELCGHHTLDPTGGVHFIEASWVAIPAFQGAQLRNIVGPETINVNTKSQMREILANPQNTPEWTQNSIPKAARVGRPDPAVEAEARRQARVAADFFSGEEEEEGVDPMAPPPDEGDAGGDDPMAPPGGDMGAPPDPMAPPGGGMPGMPGEPGAEPEKDPMETLEGDIEKYVLDKIRKKLKDKLTEEVSEDAASPPEMGSSTNENLNKQAALVAGTEALLRIARSDIELLDGLMRLKVSHGLKVSRDLYRTALRVGSTGEQEPLEKYLQRCAAMLTRTPTVGEAKTLVRLGRILSLRKKTRF